MITAGIDVGLDTTKVVILKDGAVVARGSGLSGGGGRAGAVRRVWDETLAGAGLSAADIEKTVVTGQGAYDVDFADDRVTEPIADAKAARHLFPGATSAVDIGADQVRVVTLGEGDQILEVVLNQKCSAGLGLLMEYMARRLGMGLDGISALPPAGQDAPAVSDGCGVFAELDALDLLFQGVPREQVAGAMVESFAVRYNSILNDKIRPAKATTVLMGGVTKNKAVVNALGARSGIAFLIPEHAEYCGALGAALLAAG